MNNLFLLTLLFLAFSINSQAQVEEIQWMTWEQAMKANETEPRKKFVDVYTDWCTFCKKMDATTLKDPDIIKHINENYYPIKFNAEQKDPITYNGFTFKYVEKGKSKYHQLAQSLLNGKLGYPTFLFLDEENSKILLSPGFKKSDILMKELEFATSENYKTQSFSKYKKNRS